GRHVANLAWVKPDKCSREVDMSKDTSGPKSPKELQRNKLGEDHPRTVLQSNPRDKGHLRVDVANLAWVKPDKCSREVDMSKDTSGPKSPKEFQRSWYVEGQTMSGVISLVLAQQYQETVLGSGGANLRTRQP
nr:hypothetical protein [Tanacetum cinerariifolium]